MIKKLQNSGYIKKQIEKKDLIKLKSNWISIFDKICQIKLNKRIKNEKDIIKLYFSKNRSLWVSVYNLLHLDPLIYRIASSKKILSYCKKIGIKKPHFGTRPYVRVDMPNDLKYSKFKAHQDFPYNYHSKNSVVIWIPLQSTDKELGCLRVSEKSHFKKKVFKHNHDKFIINRDRFKFKDIPCKFGEAIIFSEFLVHESGENISDKIRFSVQLRVTDLSSKEYAKRNYPVIR